ncbi:MAG: sigma 54-interacting transcriptional regulator [Planctomycetia bacterium]|nr:sigma 54-interacting transcriptional regulator [Planctomycetia bacterium]
MTLDGNTILHDMATVVLVFDQNLTITFANDAAKRLLAEDGGELVGMKCSDLVRTLDPEGDEFYVVRNTLDNGLQTSGMDRTYLTRAGKRYFLSISTAPLRADDGTIYGGVAFFQTPSRQNRIYSTGTHTFQVGNFRSCAASMQKILSNFEAISSVNSTVLITGETGTGKEILARTIHENSPRHANSFVAINCGALPEPLLESELFGYKAGAFTGADRDKPGRFAMANGGTLFLDEIGEISQAMQVRLLRVLQERSFEPLGSVKSEKTDIRVIAATNRNLTEMVAKGKFRSDLYYRLNVIHLQIPPLRERPEDIALLTEYFIHRLNKTMGRQVIGISNSVFRIFSRYAWPGNIRELENVLERSIVFCRSNVIESNDLPPELAESLSLIEDESETPHMVQVVRDSEMQAIEAALEQCNGNRRKAAELLGIHPTSLYRKLKSARQ